MQRAKARVKPVQQFFGAPKQGDLHMIRVIVGNLHVGLTNDEVANILMERIGKTTDNKKPVNGLRTLDAWRDAAIDAHIKNRELYNYVQTGYYSRRTRSPIA